MARLVAELGQQRPKKKGESVEKCLLQRKWGERADYSSRFEEGLETLQDK